jgi:hypothetical protein
MLQVPTRGLWKWTKMFTLSTHLTSLFLVVKSSQAIYLSSMMGHFY